MPMRQMIAVASASVFFLAGCASTFQGLASAESACPSTMAVLDRASCIQSEAGDSARAIDLRNDLASVEESFKAGAISSPEAHRQIDYHLHAMAEVERAANRRNAALVAAGVAAVAVAAAAASAASADGAYGSNDYGTSYASDYSYDWDRIRSSYGGYQWRCRGVQTGRFAPDHRCIGLYRDDNRWPG